MIKHLYKIYSKNVFTKFLCGNQIMLSFIYIFNVYKQKWTILLQIIIFNAVTIYWYVI